MSGLTSVTQWLTIRFSTLKQETPQTAFDNETTMKENFENIIGA